MSSWTAGYVTELTYTHGFYRELSPSVLEMVALSRGIRAPSADGPLVICELGCGQGFSANLLAAVNPGIQYHAIDFNPAQISDARKLASDAGTANVHFHEGSFDELMINSDLPKYFDIISLHGVWSWINANNRSCVVDFIRNRLRAGGLVYLSYNTLPGWAAVMPLRRLFVDHAATTTGPILPRIEQALAFAKQVLDVNPVYSRVNPVVIERLEKIQAQPRSYLAHEFFNKDWNPFYFSDVHSEMNEAKLSYVGSANLLDHIDAVNLTVDQQRLLAGVSDPAQRETIRDYMVNQQFRRDVFVKGSVRYSPVAVRDRWLDMRFALSTNRSDIPLTVKGAVGEASLQRDVYEPILDELASDPRTLRQIMSEKRVSDLGWVRLTQAMTVLVGSGHVQVALDLQGETERVRRARAFNAILMNLARATPDLQCLASPVTGNGIGVDRFQQLFLLARNEKNSDPPAFSWNIINSTGQKLIKDGVNLESPEENIAELRSRYSFFVEKMFPVLQKLGIA
jgi:SAM-dependent methyltransferase